MDGNTGVFSGPLSNYKHRRMNDLATLPLSISHFSISQLMRLCPDGGECCRIQGVAGNLFIELIHSTGIISGPINHQD